MWLGLLALFIGQFSGSGIVPIITKFGVRIIPAPEFVFFRFIIALIFFSPIFFLQKKQKLTFTQLKHLILLSFFLFINVGSFTIGVQYTTVLMTQILYAATPVIVGIMSHFFLNEKITRQKITGLCIALIGVLFLLYQSITKQEHLTFGSPLGNILILIGTFGYSGYLLYSRKLSKTQYYSSTQITFFTFLFTAVFLLSLLPFTYIFHLPPAQNTLLGILSVFTVAIATITLYFFIQVGVKLTNAFTASLFQYLAPFLAGALSVPVFGERITWNLIFGGILIIFGVFYATTYSHVKKYIRAILNLLSFERV